MLIGWASPMGNRSAIGKFSLAVASELTRRGHEVVMIRIETGAELEIPPLMSDLAVVSAHEANLASFDHVVVNFGNHAPYHSQCVSILARRAPFGIFHDAEMRDFAWGLEARHAIQIPPLAGSEASPPEPLEGSLVTAESERILGSIAAMCWGAMVHAPHYRSVISKYCCGPVGMTSLAFPDPGQKRALGERPGAPLKVLIFGVITEHKQPRRAMHALALLSEEFGPIEFHLAGDVEDRLKHDLINLATTLGIPPPLFHGYLSDENLQRIIEDAGIVLVLRNPVTEGGSASLATALYRGRPVIVANIGAYSMVPDTLVGKVSYGEDPTDLALAMRLILLDPKGAQRRAALATEWAERNFQASSYCDALLETLAQGRPAADLAGLARRSAVALRTSSGAHDVTAVKHFAESMDWLHSARGTSIGA